MRLAIGIPARNRADLTIAAIESVISTPDDRIHLLVSDNSTEPEASERIREHCAAAPGAVTYVRTPEPLSMADSWEWMWGRVRELVAPTHFALLTNRAAFIHGALPRLLSIVERHPDRLVTFRGDTLFDLSLPMTLRRAATTGQLLELDARRMIALSSRRLMSCATYLPLMCATITPTGHMTAIEERYGTVFRPRIAPDFAFAFRSLPLLDSYLHLDRACSVQYGVARSTGFSYVYGRPNEASADFEQTLPSAIGASTPEPALRTVANIMWDEYCASRAEAGGDAFPRVRRRDYLADNAAATEWIEDPALRTHNEEALRRSGWTRRAAALRAVEDAVMKARYHARHPATPRRNDEIDTLPFDDRQTALAHAAAHPRPPARHTLALEPLRRAKVLVRTLPPPAA